VTWLTAALAFVLAMILFSTIASAVTESVHRLFHLRERGLQLMLTQLFNERIAPLLAAAGQKVAADAQERFVATLTRNRAVRSTGFFGWLGYWLAPNRVTSLSSLQFAERLAQTDVGKQIANVGGPRVDAIVGELTHHFEQMGDEASAFFAQRAQTLSLLVAVAIAFVLNVDPIRLFIRLAANPVVAQQIIAMHPGQRSGNPTAPPAARGDDAEFDAAMQAARTASAEALASGLPIGGKYFPWCEGEGLGEACAELRKQVPSKDATSLATFATVTTLPELWLEWLTFSLLAGLLIGLGGPFWFDAFGKLSALVDVANALNGATKRTEATPSTATPPEPVAPRTPIEAFRAASGASDGADRSSTVSPTNS